MALVFGGANDAAPVVATSDIDNLEPVSVALWCRPTSLTTGRLFSKNVNAKTLLVTGAGEIQWLVDRAGGLLNYTTNDTPVVLNEWLFIGCCARDIVSGAAHIYTRTISSFISERSYSGPNDSSGAFEPDDISDLYIGNRSSLGQPFIGEIANFYYHEDFLSEAEFAALALRMLPQVLTRFYTQLGYPFQGNQPNRAISNAGPAAAGALILANHPPIGLVQPVPNFMPLAPPSLVQLVLNASLAPAATVQFEAATAHSRQILPVSTVSAAPTLPVQRTITPSAVLVPAASTLLSASITFASTLIAVPITILQLFASMTPTKTFRLVEAKTVINRSLAASSTLVQHASTVLASSLSAAKQLVLMPQRFINRSLTPTSTLVATPITALVRTVKFVGHTVRLIGQFTNKRLR